MFKVLEIGAIALYFLVIPFYLCQNEVDVITLSNSSCCCEYIKLGFSYDYVKLRLLLLL